MGFDLPAYAKDGRLSLGLAGESIILSRFISFLCMDSRVIMMCNIRAVTFIYCSGDNSIVGSDLNPGYLRDFFRKCIPYMKNFADLFNMNYTVIIIIFHVAFLRVFTCIITRLM